MLKQGMNTSLPTRPWLSGPCRSCLMQRGMSPARQVSARAHVPGLSGRSEQHM